MKGNGGRTWIQRLGLALGPVLFVLLQMLELDSERPAIGAMAGLAALMATWWITEAIPLAATALLPLILFPALGILSGRETAPLYANGTIFLFLGGFLIAVAMERWHLHRRIALLVIRLVGGGPARLILGFMGASALLSMWISNTATAVMMLPIGLSIVSRLEAEFPAPDTKGFAVALMLGIAYGASVGGVATLVGTPPNLVLQRVFELSFPAAPPISFGLWMVMALPVSLTMLALIWLLLTRVLFSIPAHLRVDPAIVEREYHALGPMSAEERRVLAVFGTTALLWVFRSPMNLGIFDIPGWSQLLPDPGVVDDSTVAIAMALVLFLLPTRSPQARLESPTLLDAEAIARLPWGIILLFGGGFALAEGFQVSGLAAMLGSKLELFSTVAPWLMVLCICLSLTFLTEVTSNTATTQMILPILGSMAVAMGEHPLLLMVPAALSASCAFMMPVATPPNAIVFGSGRVRIADMVRAGLGINLLGAVVITLVFYVVGTAVFEIEPGLAPPWAQVLQPGEAK